ncbi:MAG: hypothetical protein WC373_11100 [Smithella sp.]|jgi:NADH:ubiquinone oxidoreductase subunit H
MRQFNGKHLKKVILIPLNLVGGAIALLVWGKFITWILSHILITDLFGNIEPFASPNSLMDVLSWGAISLMLLAMLICCCIALFKYIFPKTDSDEINETEVK